MRLAERHAQPPRPALHQRGRQHDGAERAPAPLAAGHEAVDQQVERVLELGAGARLRQLQRLLEALRGAARDERRVAPAREVARERPGGAEAVGERRARERGELPERADPEALERLGQRGGLRARAEQGDRQRREVGGERVAARRRPPPPPPPAAAGRREAAATAAKREEATPRRAGTSSARRVTPRTPSRPPCSVEQPARVEARDAGALGLDRGADALERGEHAVPPVGHARGIGGDEPQRRAAGERLPQPQPGAHAVGLGGRGGLPDQRLAPRLRRQRDRPARQLGPPAGGDGEGEAGQQDADDHANTCSHPAGVRARVRGTSSTAPAPTDAKIRQSPDANPPVIKVR